MHLVLKSNNMKTIKYFLLISFIFFVNMLFAQIAGEEDDSYDPADFSENQQIQKDTVAHVKNTNKNSKLSYKIDLGTSFTSTGYGSFLDVYTAPQISYKFSPRMELSTGVLLINSTIPDYFQANNNVTNSVGAYLFGKLSYQATEKLRISGEILYGMNNTPYSYNTSRNKSDYYIDFNAEYKINDSFKIGLRVSNSNLNSPYGLNPYSFNNPYRRANPLYNSPLGY